ncbi:MAG: sensor histidine kinase [Kiritimatiellia bacterium]
MKPIDWKLTRNIVCLCLPTVLVVVLGVFFLIDRVPAIIRNERYRIQTEYREQALELKNHPETGFTVTRGKSGGWAKDRKMVPGYWGTVPAGTPVAAAGGYWGTVPAGRILVWYVDEQNVCTAKLVGVVEEVDFSFIFWGCGSFVLLLLVGITWMGVRYFVTYVRSRDDFMAATAHDLTTPLVGLRHMIGRNDQEAKELNERMIRLVDNIKDFLRLGGRRTTPKLAKTDVVKCFNAAYALFREDYRDLFDGADVAFKTMGAVPVYVLADETLTVQILWNLLGNDLKYAAPYGKVWVEIARRDGMVQISFFDVGKGMTRGEMRKAFDRYYRAKTVLQSGKGGFGIGLCTAREFARQMGGDLTVRANQPQGCIFTLSLPAMEDLSPPRQSLS